MLVTLTTLLLLATLTTQLLLASLLLNDPVSELEAHQLDRYSLLHDDLRSLHRHLRYVT